MSNSNTLLAPLQQFQPGQRVRRIGAPDVQGTVLRATTLRNGKPLQRIQFDAGHSIDTDPAALEPVPESIDAIEQIRRGEWFKPEALRAQLLHQRLDGRLNEVIYSMEASNTTFLPYQFKPILSLLESPTNSVLIADEVGLGKTIESGLIWTELRARENARTLLVVCPPHLITKWKNELKNRFGVDSLVADAQLVLEKLEEAQHGKSQGFALITSYHSIRPPRGWRDDPSINSPKAKLARKLEDWAITREPFIDLLIMDEAAIMRNDSSLTSRLGELVTPVCKYKVYLSATPIHTHSRNLFTLLNRLDPESFPDFATFQSILEANAPLVRLRESLLNLHPNLEKLLQLVDEAKQSPLLENSEVLAELERELQRDPDLTDRRVCSRLAHQANRANLISHVVTRTRRRDVDSNPVKRDPITLSVTAHPIEAALYKAVTAAIIEYSVTRGISAGFLTVMPQRRVASCMAAALEGIVGSGLDSDDEISPDFDQNSTSQPVDAPLISFIRERLAGAFSIDELRSVDTKYQALLDALREHWTNHPGAKVVLFAYFKPTLAYLSKRLAADGIASLLLTGDSEGDKQDIIDAFAASKEHTILLSSEVGSEGLDLQFASTLVNYDLPWNPMVVAQRIGRIHRIGQKAQRILILNLVFKDTVDERILDRLYRRMDLFQTTIGDLEAILGEQINRLSMDLLTLRLTPKEEEERIDTQVAAIENVRIEEEALEANAGLLAAHGDYLIQRVADAHRRGDWVKGEDLEAYVVGFFGRLFAKTVLRGINPLERIYEIDLDTEAGCEFEAFLRKQNLRGSTRITAENRMRIRFDHQVFKNASSQTEVVNHSHPLVRFLNHVLWTKKIAQPVSIAAQLPASRRPENLQPGIYVFLTQRWRVEGLRNAEKLHYQLINAEGTPVLDEEVAARCVEAAALHGEPLVHFDSEDASILEDLAATAEGLESDALMRFDDFMAAQKREDADRKNLLLYNIDKFQERRSRSIMEVLERHVLNGRDGLAMAEQGKLDALERKSALSRQRISTKQIHGGTETVAAGFIIVH